MGEIIREHVVPTREVHSYQLETKSRLEEEKAANEVDQVLIATQPLAHCVDSRLIIAQPLNAEALPPFVIFYLTDWDVVIFRVSFRWMCTCAVGVAM